MRQKIAIILFSFCFVLWGIQRVFSFGDPPIISPDRVTHWENAGIPDTIPDIPIHNSVTGFGAVGDGITNDAPAFQQAIDDVPNAGGAVWIPAGTYRLEDGLTIDHSVVLRGAGAGQTFLEFDFGGGFQHAIEVVTYQRGDWMAVTAGYEKGSTSLTVTDGSLFNAGIYAEIEQDNDPVLMYTDPTWNVSWAQEAVGEFMEVVAVNGNIITLAEPLNMNYRADLNPMIRTQGLVENAGIERLHLERLDNGGGDMILLKNSAYVWVREVISTYILNTHVSAESTFKCEIRDSYFHHAHNYAGGGQGYGVEMGRHTTGCLIENNIFETLRHATMVHIGATGNVYGYNYSRDPFQNQGGTWTPPDVSLHGHYPNYNLFEGNVVQEVGIGDYWGPAGPGNTFLRNCVQAEGILADDASHQQNLVGNELGNDPNDIEVDATVTDTLAHGNYENGAIVWDAGIPNQIIPNSYYQQAAPDFFNNLAFPNTGADMGSSLGDCLIPARLRWNDGDFIPQPLNLALTLNNGTDHDLTWLHRPTFTHYDVWRDTIPYTVGTQIAGNLTPPAIGDSMAYTDSTVQPLTNYFYFIRGVESGGGFVDSGNAGIFHYPIEIPNE